MGYAEILRDSSGTALEQLDPRPVTRMKVWYSKVRDWMVLSRFRALEELEVAGYDAISLEPICGLSGLRSLRLLHFPKLRALEGLERLSRLEELSLESAPSYDTSGKYLVVDSLRPLAALTSLRVLRIFGVRAADNSLVYLANCGALKDVEIGRGFPEDQYKMLEGALLGAKLVLPTSSKAP